MYQEEILLLDLDFESLEASYPNQILDPVNLITNSIYDDSNIIDIDNRDPKYQFLIHLMIQ